ncbi:MAG: RloB domain-containing protein, partial [Victivallales bacterium]|nr:RloB domain-containing protein [Victivallales bacterium]
SQTEQQYFPMVASCNTQNVVVSMVDDGTTNSDPFHVLKRMEARIRQAHFQKDDNWEAWIVVDDEWNSKQLEELVAWHNKDVLHHHVAVVSPKFEDWLKLHVSGDDEACREYSSFLSHKHGCQDLPGGFVNKDRLRKAIGIASRKQYRAMPGIEQIYILVEKILDVKI